MPAPIDAAWTPAVRLAATHDPTTVTYTAVATGPGWVAAGGPASLVLPVQALTLDWDVDRTPICRGTLVTVVPWADIRWLSPLPRTVTVTMTATYSGITGSLGRLLLRRRRLTWPAGDVILDLASRDADLARTWGTTTIGEDT